MRLLRVRGRERRKRAAGGAQLFIRALLDHVAAVHHDNEVGAANRRQAVRNNYRRAIFHELVERALHDALGLCVREEKKKKKS